MAMAMMPKTPNTDRPAELAGTAGRSASANTQEKTHMFTAKGSVPLGWANHPSGTVDTNGRRATRILAEIAEREAAFAPAPFCDHPEAGAHPCTNSAPAPPGVAYAVRELLATVQAIAWSVERTRDRWVALVVKLTAATNLIDVSRRGTVDGAVV